MTVRLATTADVSEIVRVANAAFRVEDFFIVGDRTNVDDITAKMAGANACFLVIDAPSGAGLMASAFVELRGDRGYFGMLAVDPAHQKKGLGRIMFDAIEARCREAGCVALDISVATPLRSRSRVGTDTSPATATRTAAACAGSAFPGSAGEGSEIAEYGAGARGTGESAG